MKKTEQSIKLYNLMIQYGFPSEFADAITDNLNTDFTASKMIGYLAANNGLVSLEEVTDEMLSILDLRKQYVDKKIMEQTQARWNEIMIDGFEE